MRKKLLLLNEGKHHDQVAEGEGMKPIWVFNDGVVHDTYDPSRDGTRCVYGYWRILK